MENLVLGDTDVAIDFFNAAPPMAELVESLIREESLALSVVSVFELYAGILGKKRLKVIDLLLKSSVILPFDERIAKEAAQFFTSLKSKGKLIGNQDLFIAATAKIYELPLLTRNKAHFERIEGIEFYNLSPAVTGGHSEGNE